MQELNPSTPTSSLVMTSMDGLCSFGTSGEKGSATLSWHLIFCAGKLSDVMRVSPWHMSIRGGSEKYHWIVLPTKGGY